MTTTWWILLAVVILGAGAWWMRSRRSEPQKGGTLGRPSGPDRLVEAARRQAADPFRHPPVEMSVLFRGLSTEQFDALIAAYREALRANLDSLDLRHETDQDMVPDLRYRDDPDWTMRLDGLTADQAQELAERVRRAGGHARVRTFYSREKGFQAGDDTAELEMEFAVWTRAPEGSALDRLSDLYRDFTRRNARTLGLDPEDLSAAGEPEREQEVQVWQPLTWDQAWTLREEARRLGIPVAIRGLLPFPGE